MQGHHPVLFLWCVRDALTLASQLLLCLCRNELDNLYQETLAELQQQEDRTEEAQQSLMRLQHLQVHQYRLHRVHHATLMGPQHI